MKLSVYHHKSRNYIETGRNDKVFDSLIQDYFQKGIYIYFNYINSLQRDTVSYRLILYKSVVTGDDGNHFAWEI